jgi:hypothetical protein
VQAVHYLYRTVGEAMDLFQAQPFTVEMADNGPATLGTKIEG